MLLHKSQTAQNTGAQVIHPADKGFRDSAHRPIPGFWG